MQELQELREYIQGGRYAEALALIDELDEMSKDDKINKIESYMEILLIHLIKQHVEKRTTRSWDVSIRNAIQKINLTNKRRRAGGTYLQEDEIKEALYEAWRIALPRASLETLEGRHTAEELAGMIDRKHLLQHAFQQISSTDYTD